MPDPRTLSLYDAEAEAYADVNHSDRPYGRLEKFINAMPAGGYVLDLGCGPANFSARMIESGLRVDALDASEGMARVARERFGVEIRVGTFDDVTGEAVYDGIWAHFSLLHAPRAEMNRHLATLARALRPGGQLLLGMKLGEGEARDRRDRFYTYYSAEDLEERLALAGLRVIHRHFGESEGFDGTSHPHAILTALRDAPLSRPKG